VRFGSSCAAVTGYDFPLANPRKVFGGEGGKEVGPVESSGLRVESRKRFLSLNSQLKTLNFPKSQEPEYLPVPPHSSATWHRHLACEHSTDTAWKAVPQKRPKKLLREKEE
jgi:hypothetical protein